MNDDKPRTQFSKAKWFTTEHQCTGIKQKRVAQRPGGVIRVGRLLFLRVVGLLVFWTSLEEFSFCAMAWGVFSFCAVSWDVFSSRTCGVGRLLLQPVFYFTGGSGNLLCYHLLSSRTLCLSSRRSVEWAQNFVCSPTSWLSPINFNIFNFSISLQILFLSAQHKITIQSIWNVFVTFGAPVRGKQYKG